MIKFFEINKDYLRKRIFLHENKEKRYWFLKTYSQEELHNYREEYYTFLESVQENILYFRWFEETG